MKQQQQQALELSPIVVLPPISAVSKMSSETSSVWVSWAVVSQEDVQVLDVIHCMILGYSSSHCCNFRSFSVADRSFSYIPPSPGADPGGSHEMLKQTRLPVPSSKHRSTGHWSSVKSACMGFSRNADRHRVTPRFDANHSLFLTSVRGLTIHALQVGEPPAC